MLADEPPTHPPRDAVGTTAVYSLALGASNVGISRSRMSPAASFR